MIFPRGTLHVIGHAQLIPSVDPEPAALLISRMAIHVCVCFTRGRVKLAARRQRASWCSKVIRRTMASAAEREPGNRGCTSDRRAVLQREEAENSAAEGDAETETETHGAV